MSGLSSKCFIKNENKNAKSVAATTVCYFRMEKVKNALKLLFLSVRGTTFALDLGCGSNHGD